MLSTAMQIKYPDVFAAYYIEGVREWLLAQKK